MPAASTFVPAHISGFFEPCEDKEPTRAGSRNCGPCLEFGVLSKVRANPSRGTTLKVRINGEGSLAETTRSVVQQLMKIKNETWDIEIDHLSQVPIGAGFGASGAGALGAAHALAKSLGMKLDADDLLKVAHIAEVTCHTGLGDVGAQNLGGLVLGLSPGAPPLGKWKKIPVPKNVKIIACVLGPIQTSDLLQDIVFVRRAKALGVSAMKKLQRDPTYRKIMEVSKEFSGKLGLLDDELGSLVNAAIEAGALGASQVMLGRAVFAMVEEEKINSVRRALLNISKPETLIISKLAKTGVKII